MDDKAPLFDLKNQSPVIQLITAFSIVIVAGTLLFYLFAFAGSLIFGTDISDMLSIPAADAGLKKESILKYIQVAQQIALFVIPAIIIAMLLRRGKVSFMKTDEIPGSLQVLLVALLAIFIIPVISYTGMLNSKMNLPAWLSGVEEWMRIKENTASDMTGLLIKSSGIGELVLNIFILSVIPSIGEEMIFRGILQQILIRFFRSGHAGVWITSIIFSAIHFQFFGFLPRLVLGLSFGYLFFWSRNLWLPVIAHFINNAIPVVMSYFFSWNELNVKAKGFAEKQLLLALFAAFLIIGVFYYFWLEYRRSLVEST